MVNVAKIGTATREIGIWLKASGKTSVIETIPIIPRKVNPKQLGYICPNGNINFQSHESAMRYGKNQIVKALNSQKPYEKSIIVKNNTITYEGNGTAESCSTPLMAEGTWLHGHPDNWGKGKTLPFSATDYHTFIGNDKIDKAIVYNSFGEEASFTKNHQSSLLNQLAKKILPEKRVEQARIYSNMFECATGYTKALFNSAATAKETKDIVKLSRKKLFYRLIGNKAAAAKYGEEYEQMYNNIVQRALNDEKLAKDIHNYWVKNAKKLGVDYQTNFSNLNPQRTYNDAHGYAHTVNITGCYYSKRATEINNELQSLSAIGEPITVYRGVSENTLFRNKEFEILYKAKVGDKIQPNPGFPYFAHDKRIAQHFASSVERNIIMDINIPPAARLSVGKNELVGPMNPTYEILQKQILPNGDIQLSANYLI